MVHRATERQADWTRIPGTSTGTNTSPGSNIALGRRTHRQGVLELACSWDSSGDATHMDEIHRLTLVTARGLPLPRQASNIHRRQGTRGQWQADAGLWTEKVVVATPAQLSGCDVPRSVARE